MRIIVRSYTLFLLSETDCEASKIRRPWMICAHYRLWRHGWGEGWGKTNSSYSNRLLTHSQCYIQSLKLMHDPIITLNMRYCLSQQTGQLQGNGVKILMWYIPLEQGLLIHYFTATQLINSTLWVQGLRFLHNPRCESPCDSTCMQIYLSLPSMFY